MYALMVSCSNGFKHVGVTEYAKLRMDLNQESNVCTCNNARPCLL